MLFFRSAPPDRPRTGIFIRVAALILPLLMLFSCSGGREMRTESGGVLAPDPLQKTTVGLLNPDAEVRGVWIATVGNINYPSKKGLDATSLAGELDAILENCAELGLNAVFFQVRPTADALYKSELFPLSEYLSGTQGKAADGGFDPLAYLIDKAKDLKINVHAWVNPLRVTYGSAKYPKTDLSALAMSNPARKNPDWVIPYADGKLYFDAGNPDVREYIAAGVKEIVENYAVDGVVFDDYFYPYPVKDDFGTAVFDDSASFAKYGGGQSLDDWRRSNINALIKSCYEAVKDVRSECLFGVSPFGIWQNASGENGGSATHGLEAYKTLYCDALEWAKGGYVDYIAPQLYWRYDTDAAPYGELLRFWNASLDGTGVKLLISHAAYMYETWESPEGELTRQISDAREALCYRGSILYGYAAIERDAAGIRMEADGLFAEEIIYSDVWETGEKLSLYGITDMSETYEATLAVNGKTDPTLTLYFDGKKVSRAKDGSFELDIPLSYGENELVFICGDEKKVFTVTRNQS